MTKKAESLNHFFPEKQVGISILICVHAHKLNNNFQNKFNVDPEVILISSQEMEERILYQSQILCVGAAIKSDTASILIIFTAMFDSPSPEVVCTIKYG